MKKRRLSASIDARLLAAAEAAARRGRARNVSAWVSTAIERQLEHERKMKAFDEFISAYEAKYGVITDEEMEEAGRWAKEQAIANRSPRRRRRSA